MGTRAGSLSIPAVPEADRVFLDRSVPTSRTPVDPEARVPLLSGPAGRIADPVRKEWVRRAERF